MWTTVSPRILFWPRGQVLLVLPFDPAMPANAGRLNAFQTHYGMGTNVALLGGVLGPLPDGGGTLQLRRADTPPAEDPDFVPLLLEDEVVYGATLPWPPAAAGTGPALMRRGPTTWGNDPESWGVASQQLATPGAAPLADEDGDSLPDIYELETFGGTNVVGSSASGDTDGDGLSDRGEYVAGTSSTNANSRFEIDVTLLPGGGVLLGLQTQPISGLGYFGLKRVYDLEQTTQLDNPGAWNIVPGHANLAATGDLLTYTNSAPDDVWFARARVSLQNDP